MNESDYPAFMPRTPAPRERTPLEYLRHGWGSAYRIEDKPGPGAKRKDGTGDWITAETWDELEAKIKADYAAHPVSRDDAP